MKTIYRSAFNLNNQASAEVLMDQVSSLAWGWVLDPKRLIRIGATPFVTSPSQAESFAEQEVFPGWRVQTHRIAAEDSAAWGFRLTHPDSEDSELSWTTELTVAVNGTSQPYFTCSSSIAYHGSVMRPIRRHPSRPRIVVDVLEKIGGASVYPLLTRPIGLTESDGDRATLVGALLSPKRTHPLVLISVDNESQQPLVDPSYLASHLAGLAHVVLARNSTVTWNLCQSIPNQLNTYHGAVRLYWPGLRLSDSSYQHPLWSPQSLDGMGDGATKELTLQLLESIASISSFKVPENFLTWDRVLDLDRRKAIAEAKQIALKESETSGKTTVWAKMLEDENFRLNFEISSLRQKLAAQAEATEFQRSMAENYRSALDQWNKEDAKGNETPALASVPPDSVAKALANAARDHEGKLVFAFNTKSEHKACPFMAPDEVERAFNWLATSYWNARSGVEPCADLDKSVRDLIPGWSYSGGQKRHSVGKHESWYQCKWNGKDYWIGEHLGCGTSKRPEETIRIAFAWDDDAKKAVIGFIGQHQRNANT